MAWRGKEVRVQTEFGEESGEITFRRAVLEPVCLRRMTSGPQSSVTEREKRGNCLGGGSCWAVGSFSGWTKMVPRGPFAFFYFSFSFLFVFL
jgi:hypothetical protein